MNKCNRCGKNHDGTFGSGKFCSKSCANTRNHSVETKNKISKSTKNITPWNKGKKLRWETSSCLHCGNDIHHYKSTPKKYHKECWLKISGGYRKGSGRGKSGWFRGYWCDSSYELVWIIYQLDHNKDFKRNTTKYKYKWKGKIKKYLPDFIQNDEIIEIKGFMTEQTKAKLKSVPNLKILFKKDLKAEFDYVESKYGKNFIELYEDNPYNIKNNKCKVCNKPAKNIYCSRQCAGIGNNINSKIK